MLSASGSLWLFNKGVKQAVKWDGRWVNIEAGPQLRYNEIVEVGLANDWINILMRQQTVLTMAASHLHLKNLPDQMLYIMSLAISCSIDVAKPGADLDKW